MYCIKIIDSDLDMIDIYSYFYNLNKVILLYNELLAYNAVKYRNIKVKRTFVINDLMNLFLV